MPNDQLVDYISSQVKSGVAKDAVRSALTGVGWSASDIDEAFKKADPGSSPAHGSISSPAISSGPASGSNAGSGAASGNQTVSRVVDYSSSSLSGIKPSSDTKPTGPAMISTDHGPAASGQPSQSSQFSQSSQPQPSAMKQPASSASVNFSSKESPFPKTASVSSPVSASFPSHSPSPITSSPLSSSPSSAKASSSPFPSTGMNNKAVKVSDLVSSNKDFNVMAAPLKINGVEAAGSANSANPQKNSGGNSAFGGFGFGAKKIGEAGQAEQPGQIGQGGNINMSGKTSSGSGSGKILPIAEGIVIVILAGFAVYLFIQNGSLTSRLSSSLSSLSGSSADLTSKLSDLQSQTSALDASNTALTDQVSSLTNEDNDLAANISFLAVPANGSVSAGAQMTSTVSGILSLAKSEYRLTTQYGVLIHVENSKAAAAMLEPLIGSTTTITGTHLPGSAYITVLDVNGSSITAPAATTAAGASSTTAPSTAGAGTGSAPSATTSASPSAQ